MFIFCSVNYRCWKTKNVDLYRPLRSAHEGTLSFPRYSTPAPPACYVISFQFQTRTILVSIRRRHRHAVLVSYNTTSLLRYYAMRSGKSRNVDRIR